MSTSVKITKTVDGPSSKTTSYSTTTSSYERSFKPTVRPRGQGYSRTSYGGGGGGGYSVRREVSYGMGAGMGGMVPAGAYQTISHSGVASIKSSRDKEKKDMQDLNERFANYIEKVRFLEAQNRKLAQELDALKQKWGKETAAVKAMYQAELDEARKLLDDAEKEKSRLEIRAASLEEQIDELKNKLDDANQQNDEYRERIERQNTQMSEYVAEIDVLRRRVEQLESDHERDRKEIARLQDALNRARHDLDNETLQHIDAENRRQTLEEELEFLKNVHEQELKELAALAYRDTTQENREFWKSEMSSALREIQNMYDDKMDTMKGEMESFYNMKIQEFRTGASRQNMETVHAKETTKKMRDQLTALKSRVAELEARNGLLETENAELKRRIEEMEVEFEEEKMRLQTELGKLQVELEAVLKELQDLMDTKLGLELEIAAYRKLLEGEENRYVMSVGGGGGGGSSSMSMSSMSGGGMSMSGGGMSSGGMSMSSGGGMSGGDGTIKSSSASYSYSSSSHGGMSGGMSASTDDDRMGGQSQVVKGEMSAKTTYQRSAKGPVSISECSADGKFICLENTGRRAESLEGWKINRIIDGRTQGDFVLPRDFTIPPGRKVKIWAKGKVENPGPHDIESNNTSWGIGANITTKLINTANEDRATHVQKTMYSS